MNSYPFLSVPDQNSRIQKTIIASESEMQGNETKILLCIACCLKIP